MADEARTDAVLANLAAAVAAHQLALEAIAHSSPAAPALCAPLMEARALLREVHALLHPLPVLPLPPPEADDGRRPRPY
jgi:hypothetical protein